MFRLYNSEGYQVEPNPDGTVRADNHIRSFIKHTMSFYLDQRSQRVIARLRARSPVVSGNRPAQYYLKYSSDDESNPVEDAVDCLERLETQNDGWIFIRDEAPYDTIWLLTDEPEGSLLDFGLSNIDIITITRLLEDGEQLQFGTTGSRRAAHIISHFLRETKSDISVAISPGGQAGPVESANLLIMTGHQEKFVALDDYTEAMIESRQENIEEQITDYYQTSSIELIEELVSSEKLDLWEKQRELSALRKFVEGLTRGEILSKKIQSKAALEVVELMAALHSESSTEVPDALTDEMKQSIWDEVINKIQREREQVEESISNQLDDRINPLIDEIAEQDYETAHTHLTYIDSRLDGEPVEIEPNRPNPLDEVVEFVENLQSRDVLDPGKTELIKSRIRNRIDEERNALREQRKRKYVEQFEEIVQAAKSEYLQHVKNAVHTANQDTRIPANPLDGLRDLIRDGRTDPANVPEDAQKVVSEVDADPHLRQDDVRDVKNEIEGIVSSEISEISNELEQVLISELDSQFDRISQKGPDESAPELYNRLSAVRQSCFQSLSLVNHENLDADADQFIATIELVENTPVLSGLASEIKDEYQSRLKKRLEDITKQRKSRFKDIIDDVIWDIKDDCSTPEDSIEAIRYLDALNNALESRTELNSEHFPIDGETEATLSRIIEVLSDPDAGSDILSPADKAAMRREVKEDINHTKQEIKNAFKEKFEKEFGNQIAEIGEINSLKTANEIDVLEHLQDCIDGFDDPLIDRLGFKRDLPSEDRRKLQSVFEKIGNVLEATRPGGLSDEINTSLRTELNKEHLSILNERLDDVRSAHKDELLQDVKSTAESKLEAEIDDPSIEQINADIDTLKKELAKLGGGPNQFPAVPRTNTDGAGSDIYPNLDRLDSKEKNAFVQEFDEYRSEKLSERKQQRSRIVRERIEDSLNRIVADEKSAKIGLRAVNDIRKKLSPNTTSKANNPHPVYNTQSTGITGYEYSFDHAEHLEEHDQGVLKERIEEVEARLSDSLENEVIDTIDSSLQEWLNSPKIDNSRTALNSFKELVNGRREAYDPKHDSLSNAIQEFQKVEDLRSKGIIDPKTYENIKEKTKRNINNYMMRDPVAPDDSLKNTIEKVKSNPRRALTLLVALAVLSVTIIALAQLGPTALGGLLPGDTSDPSDGATGPQPGDTGPLTGITIERQDSSGRQKLLIRGTANSNVSQVEIQLTGQGLEKSRRPEVKDGSFAASFDTDQSGTYTIKISPVNSEEPLFTLEVPILAAAAEPESTATSGQGGSTGTETPQTDGGQTETPQANLVPLTRVNHDRSPSHTRGEPMLSGGAV